MSENASPGEAALVGANPRSPSVWSVLATTLVVMCATHASAQDPHVRPTGLEEPCQYWGTYEFFHFAEEGAVPACLRAGEDLHAPADELGRTPLHNAARAWKESFIRDLLAAGAGVNARDRLGRTPLHYAADHARPVEPDHTDVIMLFPFSVEGGPAVAALLAAGADVNARDVRGDTPLHLAWSEPGPIQPADDYAWSMDGAATLLLEAGADPAALNDRGQPASPGDCRSWHLRSFALAAVPRELRGMVLRKTFTPVLGDYGECVAAGADVAARDPSGRTVLHHAAGLADTSAVGLLLDAGAELDARARDGTTPLHAAARAGKAATVAMLLERGANVNVTDNEGATPLYIAARNGKLAVAIDLLEAGADVNVLAAHGTPLHASVSGEDRLAIADRLASPGADPSQPVADRSRPVSEPVTAGTESVERGDAAGADALLCDWSAGNYANLGSPFVFPVESVAGCLAAGTSPEVPASRGRTPIFWLPAGDIEVLSLLLDAGADVRVRSDYGRTPLHEVAAFWRAGADYAVAAGRALLRAGADPGAKGREGRTPLHEAAVAARAGSRDAAVADMLSLLVEAGADLHARAANGQTALHLALNSPSAAARLLELGADPTARNDSGRVADPVSCENFGTRGHFGLAGGDLVTRCVETVLRRGGGMRWETALHVAAGTARDPDVIRALLRAGASVEATDGGGNTPLHTAATTGAPAVMRVLLEAGADPSLRVEVSRPANPWDPKDWTPLHLAARNRDPGVVALLLEAGANVNARVHGYETALHTAARNGNPLVAELLLDAGAEVDAREVNGKTPLHVAARENSNAAVLMVLIEAGADLEARAMHPRGLVLRGLTPMYLAALGNGNPEIVATLAEAGATVDAERAEFRPDYPFWSSVSKSGLHNFGDLGHKSPLHLAALFNGNPDVLAALVRAGADLELRNRKGRTALHLAAQHNPSVFPALLALGADPTVVDDEGKTPMEYARLNRTLHGLPEVRRLLVGGSEGAR